MHYIWCFSGRKNEGIYVENFNDIISRGAEESFFGGKLLNNEKTNYYIGNPKLTFDKMSRAQEWHGVTIALN